MHDLITTATVLLQTHGPTISLPDWLQPVANAGLPGVILAWFMLRNERNSEEIKRALSDQTRAILIQAVSTEAPREGARQAAALMKEIDERRERKR